MSATNRKIYFPNIPGLICLCLAPGEEENEAVITAETNTRQLVVLSYQHRIIKFLNRKKISFFGDFRVTVKNSESLRQDKKQN